MKNLFLFIGFCLFAVRSFAQMADNIPFKPDETMFPFGKKAYRLKDSIKVNYALKQQLVKKAMPLFEDESRASEYSVDQKGFNEKKFINNFIVIDINNDGHYDLIYNGPSGGEETEIAVALNGGKTFKLVFRQLGYLADLEFKNNKLSSIAIVDYGCCMDHLDFNKVYKINFANNKVSLTLVYLSSHIQNIFFPKVYFSSPVHFEVLNNFYKMRLEPAIDDTSKVEIEGFLDGPLKGNVIDTLNKGTRGRAIATQTDVTGREWWLVEVDRNYNAHNNLFYEENNDNIRKASKIGWISSRYVKRLDE